MIPWLVLTLLTLPLFATSAGAADADTLQKIKRTNTITLGYREASRPFSFSGEGGKPDGYSVELCTRVAAAIGKQLALPSLQVKWTKVTVDNRIPSVVNGTIDLECGSTTASLSRQERVDFSLLTFIDGGSLLIVEASGVRGVGTLGGKRVAVIPGTTTEASLSTAMKKLSVTATVVPVKDHDAGVAALDTGAADAYASDRVILIGVGRTSKSPEKLTLNTELFSYEPYGLMMRRNDAAFRLAVNRALAAMYRSGEIVKVYERWFESMTTAGPVIGAMFLINSLPE